MKVLKRIGIGLLVVVGVIAIALWLLSSVYKDEVEAIIVEQINASLKTKIDVGGTNFSLIRKFPYASLEFENVTAYEVGKEDGQGVLFKASSIFLKLHLLDLLRNKQTLERIEMDNAIVNLRVWKDGSDNYHFWESSDSSRVNVELNNVHFTNVALYYINDLKDVNIQMDLEALELSGDLNNDKYLLNAETRYFIHSIKANNRQIVSGKSVWVSSDVEVDNTTGVYTIHKSAWKVEDIELILAGSARDQEDGLNLNVSSKGADLELETVVSLLPVEWRRKAESYDLSGKVTYDIDVKGLLSNKTLPGMELSYNVTGASVSHSGVDLDEVSLTGKYSNGKKRNMESSSVQINSFSALLEGGQVKGTLSVENLLHPAIDLSMHLKGDLEDYSEWLHVDTIEYADGSFETQLEWSGRFQDLSHPQPNELKGVKSSGFLQLEHAGIKFESLKYELDEINGKVSFNNERWNFNNISGKYGSTDVQVSGNVDRVYQYLLGKEGKLLLDFTLHSKLMELQELLTSADSDDESEYAIEISEGLEGKIDLSVDELIFGEFSAQAIKSSILIKDKVISGRGTELSACGGQLAGIFDIDNTKQDQLLFTTECQLEQIDIERLFYEFDNFSQDAIIDQNLNGKANAFVEFASVWSSTLHIDLDRLYADVDLEITEGRLKDYKPLEELSKFIEIDELMDIRFSKMNTNVVISDRTVHIPKTDIQSSALNLVLSGTHTFSNEIDYQFVVRMKDVLSKKARKAKKENSEFGIIEDDGLYTRLYLRMTGTVDEPEFKYDRHGVKEKWQEEMQQEKRTIKSILKDEFNWFSNDTTVKVPEKKEEGTGFEIEWEDTPGKDSVKTDGSKPDKPKGNEEKNENKDEGKLKKWLNKVSDPNEEEYEDPPE